MLVASDEPSMTGAAAGLIPVRVAVQSAWAEVAKASKMALSRRGARALRTRPLQPVGRLHLFGTIPEALQPGGLDVPTTEGRAPCDAAFARHQARLSFA